MRSELRELWSAQRPINADATHILLPLIIRIEDSELRRLPEVMERALESWLRDVDDKILRTREILSQNQ